MGIRDRKRLAEFFRRGARERGITIGRKFVAELRRVLSVQAPTRVLPSGRVVATTRAKPFAPPRRVTGGLQGSVRLTETKNGCRVRIGKPYGMPLELSAKHKGWPHQYFRVAADRLGIKLLTQYGSSTNPIWA